MEVNGLSAGIYDYDRAAAGVQPVLHFFFHVGVTVIWRYNLDRDIGRALGKAVGLANLPEPSVGYEREIGRARTWSGSVSNMKPVSAI